MILGVPSNWAVLFYAKCQQPRGCGVSVLGDLQKPSGRGPGGPAGAGGWSWWPPEVPAASAAP